MWYDEKCPRNESNRMAIGYNCFNVTRWLGPFIDCSVLAQSVQKTYSQQRVLLLYVPVDPYTPILLAVPFLWLSLPCLSFIKNMPCSISLGRVQSQLHLYLLLCLPWCLSFMLWCVCGLSLQERITQRPNFNCACLLTWLDGVTLRGKCSLSLSLSLSLPLSLSLDNENVCTFFCEAHGNIIAGMSCASVLTACSSGEKRGRIGNQYCVWILPTAEYLLGQVVMPAHLL